jgi:hypothetical protein
MRKPKCARGTFLERMMQMDVRIQNGTPLHGPSLCETCSRAHIARGYSEGELLVICQATYFEHRMDFRVRECSDYVEKQRQTLYQMEQIAWVLAPREGKRKAGFVPAGEMKESEIELILSEPE